MYFKFIIYVKFWNKILFIILYAYFDAYFDMHKYLNIRNYMCAYILIF